MNYKDINIDDTNSSSINSSDINQLKVRVSTLDDLEEIMDIYKRARSFMKEVGNESQWGDDYPTRELILHDIHKKESFVIHNRNQIHGVFAFIFGEDPTYHYIEDGQWLNMDPYGTIHRIASDGKQKGLLKTCVDFCKNYSHQFDVHNIRIDTHHDNSIMQHLILKNRFKECGTIFVGENDPRIAYQLVFE